MSEFSSEAMFDQNAYDMNDHIFQTDGSLLVGREQPSYIPSAASPSISSSQSLQPSMSTMSHSSVMSATSTASSSMGSPFIPMHHDNDQQLDEWAKSQWGMSVEAGMLQHGGFSQGFMNEQLDEAGRMRNMEAEVTMGFIAPNVVQPVDMSFYQLGMTAGYDGFMPDFSEQMHQSAFPISSPLPARSPTYESPSSSVVPSLGRTLTNQTHSQNGMSRQASVESAGSNFSKGSPRSTTAGFEEDANERGRCPYSGCGRVFKDLRAHKLTHQSERPEKCPIEKCSYHTKGFARKYDQTRHTLTHYKGTMVCGFCPGSGSASEKSFNRADVFKRHLTSVHGVEQTPANCRRKSPNSTKKAPSKDDNKEGKCSTCGTVFASAQDLYNHLDDCVMKILEKPDVSEAHNERHLMSVAGDQNVKATLERNNLPVEVDDELVQGSSSSDEDDDEDAQDSKGQKMSYRTGKSARGMTRSKGGIPTISKGRRKRKDYPHSWGCSKEQMKMKKRVLCVFDGQRRLWKDEMMMDNDYEVRVPLKGSKDKYVTDLDWLTLDRANALHNATEEEKGSPWVKVEEVTRLML